MSTMTKMVRNHNIKGHHNRYFPSIGDFMMVVKERFDQRSSSNMTQRNHV